VQTARSLAVVAAFSGLIVGSNLLLADLPDVKLLDTLVFVAAFLFGFRVGASVAVVSELAWSFVSPWGIAGYITPFLVLGELIYALAGWAASRVWRGQVRPGSADGYFIGAVLAICAFVWDIETNLGTALIAFGQTVTLEKVISTELLGTPFMLFHELSDFLLGAFFAPIVILLVPRVMRLEFRSKIGGEETGRLQG
jgi:hypothetical protein